jgi:Zn-dependent M32 family carboxypeptidase
MLSHEQIRSRLTTAEAQERLAALEHERWSRWQRYLHDQCRRQDDGSLVIPADLVERWEGQMNTPYAELSAAEQQSDLEQVETYLPTVIDILR